MIEKIKIQELGITITSGQLMKRVTANIEIQEEYIESRKIVVPKSIHADGSIDISEMPEEYLKVPADPKRLTEVGDIVIKLSTSYEAGMIFEESAGCLVPSFCAIIKKHANLDATYLLAFFNSAQCKEQIQAQVAGSVMAVISVGKISNLLIPVPDMAKQAEIGERFLEAQRRLRIIRKISILEAKRNDIVFGRMEDNDGEQD